MFDNKLAEIPEKIVKSMKFYFILKAGIPQEEPEQGCVIFKRWIYNLLYFIQESSFVTNLPP